jgi:hypothetical protein
VGVDAAEPVLDAGVGNERTDALRDVDERLALVGRKLDRPAQAYAPRMF